MATKPRQPILVPPDHHDAHAALRQGLPRPLPHEAVADHNRKLPRLHHRPHPAIVAHLREHETGIRDRITPGWQFENRPAIAHRRRHVPREPVVEHPAYLAHRREHPFSQR